MKSLLFVLSQLILVTLVYAFAYRAGYRSAQSRAMSVVRKFADPVTCLLDQLNESIDESKDDEEVAEALQQAGLIEEGRTLPKRTTIERSASNEKKQNLD